MRTVQECHPLDDRTEEPDTTIGTLIDKLLKDKEVYVDFQKKNHKSRAKCRCLIGVYTLSTYRPSHTVKVHVSTMDDYRQRNSRNDVYAWQWNDGQKAGSELEVIVDGVRKKKMLLTPIVDCDSKHSKHTPLQHTEFVKEIARREMNNLIIKIKNAIPTLEIREVVE